jgi:hypothetical protein
MKESNRGDLHGVALFYLCRYCGTVRIGIVIGMPAQQLECVRKKRKDSFEGVLSSPGASGQIDDEGTANGSADGAAEGCERGLPNSHCAHAFRQPFDEPFADHPGCFRGNVSRGEPCTSRSHDQVRGGGSPPQSFCNEFDLIGNCLPGDDRKSSPFQEIGDGGAGEILSKSLKTTVANG